MGCLQDDGKLVGGHNTEETVSFPLHVLTTNKLFRKGKQAVMSLSLIQDIMS